ncbi:MAG: nucleoside deaminase [Bacteroidales bacterium]|nr:nucleoside deaminase [Bacteroidales bacterium]
MPTYEEKFMRKAIELSGSNINLKKGGPFGAVIVKDGQIIAEAVNTVLEDNDPTAHAEINAIRQACSRLGSYQLTDCEIYCSCEPCPMCLGAIYWARPKKIYFAALKTDAEEAGFDDFNFYNEFAKEPAMRSIPSESHMRSEARLVFGKWKEAELFIVY